MLLLYIIKQPPFFKVQKSRRVVSYKKHMTKRGYAFVDNSRFAFVITPRLCRSRYQNKYNQAAFAADKRSRKAECSARTGIQTHMRS